MRLSGERRGGRPRFRIPWLASYRKIVGARWKRPETKVAEVVRVEIATGSHSFSPSNDRRSKQLNQSALDRFSCIVNHPPCNGRGRQYSKHQVIRPLIRIDHDCDAESTPERVRAKTLRRQTTPLRGQLVLALGQCEVEPAVAACNHGGKLRLDRVGWCDRHAHSLQR